MPRSALGTLAAANATDLLTATVSVRDQSRSRYTAWEVGLRVRMTILAVIGLSLLSTIVAPALAQEATPVAAAGCTAGSSGIGDPVLSPAGKLRLRRSALHPRPRPRRGRWGDRRRHAPRSRPSRCSTSARSISIFVAWRSTAITVDGQPASFTRHGGELTVEPDAPLAAGARFTTEIAYHGEPIGQEAPTVGTLLGDIFGAILGRRAEQKPAPRRASSTAPGGGRGARRSSSPGSRPAPSRGSRSTATRPTRRPTPCA